MSPTSLLLEDRLIGPVLALHNSHSYEDHDEEVYDRVEGDPSPQSNPKKQALSPTMSN